VSTHKKPTEKGNLVDGSFVFLPLNRAASNQHAGRRFWSRNPLPLPSKPLAFEKTAAIVQFMAVPNCPVTISPAEVEELRTKLSMLRHNVNNSLSLVIAATELIRRKPEMASRMVDTLSAQPQKIIEEIAKFCEEIERLLQIQSDSR
jgi:hypothetical protein